MNFLRTFNPNLSLNTLETQLFLLCLRMDEPINHPEGFRFPFNFAYYYLTLPLNPTERTIAKNNFFVQLEQAIKMQSGVAEPISQNQIEEFLALVSSCITYFEERPLEQIYRGVEPNRQVYQGMNPVRLNNGNPMGSGGAGGSFLLLFFIIATLNYLFKPTFKETPTIQEKPASPTIQEKPSESYICNDDSYIYDDLSKLK